MINQFFPLKYGPVVCAVGHNYIIMVPVRNSVLIKVDVGGKEYFNVSNGIRIRNSYVQKFTVPMAELDNAKEYTVICEIGKQYESKKTVSRKYKFIPVPSDREINIYDISDTHGMYKESIAAAANFNRKIDLLILNGDISSSSETINDILLNYKIAFSITKGEIPCIITRGNHDLRGKNAEKLPELMPYRDNKPYFTVTIGDTWFMILDCGEDKVDSHKEYYHGAAFHDFRLQETEYIKDVIKNADKEYNAPGIKKRILVSHIAINYEDNELCQGERPFNIEHEIYNSWCSLIEENIKPNIYITGHLHIFKIFQPESEFNNRKLSCPTIVGGEPGYGKKNKFTGAGIVLHNDHADVIFTDSNGFRSETNSLNF